MTIQKAIAIIKEYREWENSWEDINTSEFSPYTDETYREAIDTVVRELERQELSKEMLSKISTKEYGEDGVGLSKEDLDECLYK